MSLAKRIITLLLVASVASMTATSAAQEPTSAEEEATARSLYEAGLRAFESGRFEIALDSFSAGYELSHRGRFLFNMASCFDRLHRTSEAVAHYERFLEAQPETENRPHVERRLELLRMELREAEEEREEEEPQEQAPQRSAFLRAPALIGFGLGVAGLATFAVAGAVSSGQYSDLENTCSPACSDAAVSPARRNTLIADVGLGVGVAAITFAIIYGLVARDSNEESEAEAPAAELRVEARAEGAVLGLGGHF